MARSLALSGADFDARSTTNTALSSTLDSPLSDNSNHTQTSATSTSQRSDASLLRNRQVSSAASPAASETVAEQRQLLKKVLGWPRLAELMAMKPGLESFSRFRELNVKNLLYYQVQLAALEEDLEEAEKKDYGEQHRKEKYAKYADNMIESGDDDPGAGADGRQDRQVDIVMKIRRLLKEYNECLLLYNQVSSLPEPENLNLRTLREWLERAEYGNMSIRGAGSNAWGDLTKEHRNAGYETNWQKFLFLFYNPIWPRVPRPQEALDLVAVVPRREPDGFTRWIAHRWIPFWHGLKNPERQARSEAANADLEKDADATTSKNGNNTDSCDVPTTYAGSVMQMVASSVATVIACVLPTLAIGILAVQETLLQRLLYIGGFTLIFAATLMALTDRQTPRTQVFTATAAFSAVLVVFVQGQ